MIYKVRARFKPATAAHFLEQLTDGTIAAQKPEGMEILESMQRAVVTDDGTVEWSESCFCATPLAHERETVYDRYFEAFQTEEIDDYQHYQGRKFMDYLAELTDSSAH